VASEKQIAANRRNATKSTGPRTQEGKARSCMNKHTPVEIGKRLRQIERQRVKTLKLIDLIIEKTTPDQLDRAVRRMANLDRYSARAYSRLKKIE
jgi:hypothetical protein